LARPLIPGYFDRTLSMPALAFTAVNGVGTGPWPGKSSQTKGIVGPNPGGQIDTDQMTVPAPG